MGRSGGIFRHTQKKISDERGKWVVGFFTPTMFSACIGIYKLQEFSISVLYLNCSQVLHSQRITPSAQRTVVKPGFVFLSFAN